MTPIVGPQETLEHALGCAAEVKQLTCGTIGAHSLGGNWGGIDAGSRAGTAG
jgi:hypothetical protein